MAYTDRGSAPFAIVPSPLSVIAAFANGIVRRVQKYKARKETVRLLAYEDWFLKDLGVTRDDVHEALSDGENPSLRLQSIAAEKRRVSKLTR